MKKLRIKFWQIENVVLMKVLDQDESLRDEGELFKSDSLDMAILSNGYPAITWGRIFIRGNIKGKDNIVCSNTFNSIEDATVYIEKCQELIRDYNISLGEEEMVKTFIFE